MLAFAAVAVGCAQDLPGTVPPGDQLHFPIGLKLVNLDGTDFLIVGSSNFDQRFNSGRVFAMSVPTLSSLVLEDSSDVLFYDNFGDAITSSVRVDSFSGELEVITLDPGGDLGPAPYILSPSRGRDELTLIRFDGQGRLSCTSNSERQTGFDCTDSHRIAVQGRDPFVVGVSEVGDQSVVAVGALQASNPIPGIFEGTVTFMTSKYLEARIADQLPPQSSLEDCNILDIFLISVRGISGMAPLAATSTSTARFLSLSFRSASPNLGLEFHNVTLTEPQPVQCNDASPATLQWDSQPDLRFDLAFSAFETRGLVTSSDGTRAYATFRIADSVDTTNGGVAVMDITGDNVALIDILEVGEELGRPHLDERPDGSKLLYIGDQRFDLIYVVDVSTDKARVATRIESRGLRDFGSRTLEVKLLDQPSQIVFAQSGNRRLAFVTNFSNSTLGVLDITDPDPLRHRVAARFGRDLDPQGRREGE